MLIEGCKGVEVRSAYDQVKRWEKANATRQYTCLRKGEEDVLLLYVIESQSG